MTTSVLGMQRPMSGLSQSMRVNLDRQNESFTSKRYKSIRMASYRLPKIESDDPEDVSLWLDKFEDGLKEIGKSYEYPRSKFLRSRQICDSNGYRTTIYMHKSKDSFGKYKQLLTGRKPSSKVQAPKTAPKYFVL